MELTFLGATRTVTGSKYLIEDKGKRFLIDCGLFQGLKELRLRNWAKPAVDPASIDAVILTHAHIDHSGGLPILTRDGFSGPIYTTDATRDLCGILLPDAGRIQEEDARRANRYGYSKHSPAKPLFDEEDAHRALRFFETIQRGKAIPLAEELTFQASHAGHILGASMVMLRNHDTSILFTGDLGRQNDPIMRAPAVIHDADYLVMDATYGLRSHPDEDPVEALAAIIRRTIKKGGTVLIPAFAVGRSQTILYFLYLMKQANQIPDVPIYLDSPMAQNATDLFCRHASEHKLSPEISRKVCEIAKYVRKADDSKALDLSKFPSIILSASGMAEGGRVLHHIRRFGPDSHSSIVFVGFQAAGTRGERMLRGEREIKIHGAMVPIRASVEYVESLSSHSDYKQSMDWLAQFRQPPRKIFLTHGEPESCKAMKERIEAKMDTEVVIPDYLHKEKLD